MKLARYRLFFSGVLLALFVVTCGINDRPRESSGARIRAAGREALVAKYNANKDQIRAEIEEAISERSDGRAWLILQRYIEASEGDLDSLHNHVRVLRLDREVRSVPASNYRKNSELYSELARLAPENERYRTKRDRYNVLVDSQKIAGRTQREGSSQSYPDGRRLGGMSMARHQLSRMKGALDVTTPEQFTGQMPDEVLPARLSRNGINRVFTFTFEDKSKIEATFRPRGDDGSGEGLVLYMIDVEE